MTSCLDKVWLTGGGVRTRTCLGGGTSPLFIVRVRTRSPVNGWGIAIFSKVLPNDVILPTQVWLIVVYKKKCCQMTSFQTDNSLIDRFRIGHFLTTYMFVKFVNYYILVWLTYTKKNLVKIIVYISIFSSWNNKFKF